MVPVGNLSHLGFMLIRPRQQIIQRSFDIARRMDDEPDAQGLTHDSLRRSRMRT